MDMSDRAIKEFRRQLPEYQRLLAGHRVLRKNYLNWKTEFDLRITLDMYTAEKSVSLLPQIFAQDELTWIEALKTRLEALHFNMNFLHQQRQLLEKAHHDLSKLVEKFNKNHKFITLNNLPVFEPQNYFIPEIPKFAEFTVTSSPYNVPNNMTFVEDSKDFADRALSDFRQAKEDCKKCTNQMSEAKKAICSANAAADNEQRFANLKIYRQVERGMNEAAAKMKKIADESLKLVTRIKREKIENLEWELGKLSELVDEYQNFITQDSNNKSVSQSQ